MPREDWIKTVPVASAEELLAAISPVSEHFYDSDLNAWMFRGECDWDVPLVASINRPQDWQRALNIVRMEDFYLHADCLPNSRLYRVFVELELMHEFIELADEAGLQLPDVSQEFGQWFGGYRRWLISLLKAENPMQDALKLARSEFGKRENFPDRANWPCGYILPFLGLARHYGLPTRLLDWSWNPLVGAFFAARDIMRNLDDQKDFPKTASVWAVARKCTGHITFLPEPHPQLLRTERCYNSGNPHMHAQRGIFTCCPTSCNNFWDEEATGGLDIVLYDRMEFIRCQDDNVASEILLYRFQFKREIYGELLYLLARHGVKGHLLFPSFHGVASSLTERFHYCDQGVGESRGEDPSVQ